MKSMEIINNKDQVASELQNQLQSKHDGSHLIATAIHHHLGSAAGAVASSAPSSSSYDPNSMQWPWDPNENYTPYSSGGSSNESPEQMLQDWEHYLENFEAGSGSTYNDALEHLQELIALGNKYNSLTPDEKTLFNQILQKITDGGNNSIVGEMMKLAMQGAMIKNGTSASGLAATNLFLQQLVAACAPFAGDHNSVLSDLAYQAQNEAAIVKNMMANDIVTFTDGGKSITVFMVNGVVLDFNNFVQQEEGAFGRFITQSNISSVIQNFYGIFAENIMDEFRDKNGKLTDPWLVLILLLGLLNGQDTDMGIAIKGYGNQLNAMKKELSQISALMGKMKNGNLSPADAKTLMNNLASLQADVNNNPLMAGLAPYLNEALSDIMGQGVPLPMGPDGKTPLAYYTVKTTNGLYVVPNNLPPGTVVKDSNGNVLVPGQTYYYASGETLTITPPAGTTLTLSQLGSNTSLDFGGGSTIDFQTLGDYTDVAAALNALGVSGGLTTDLTGMQTTINGQSATVQQQIQTLTNTSSKFEGMEDDGYTSVFKDIETTINHNLQSANQ